MSSCSTYVIGINLAKEFEALARMRGVSAVARGELKSSQTQGGFFQVAKQLKGNIHLLKQKKVKPRSDQSWWQRRDAFCLRHCAQQILQGTPLIERSGPFQGTPSRRQLGLIMWMCSSISPETLVSMLPRVKEIVKRGGGKM